MVVATQALTSRLGEGRVSGVVNYKNAWVRDLACASSPEPLNGIATGSGSLSLPRNDEGHSTQAGEPIIGRVPVVSVNGTPLMPCGPSKARKLLERGLAEKHWNKLGQFCLRLKFELKSEPNACQQVCLAEDTGSKRMHQAIPPNKFRGLLGRFSMKWQSLTRFSPSNATMAHRNLRGILQ